MDTVQTFLYTVGNATLEQIDTIPMRVITYEFFRYALLAGTLTMVFSGSNTAVRLPPYTQPAQISLPTVNNKTKY